MKSKMCAFMAIVLMGAMAPVWAEVVTDGLVVYYRADNADGAGNPGSGKLATWTDLALEFGEANNGKLNNFKYRPGCSWVENTDQPKDSPFRFGLEFEAPNYPLRPMARDGAYVSINPVSLLDEDSFTYELWLRVNKPEEARGRICFNLIGEFLAGRRELKNTLAGSLWGNLGLGHHPPKGRGHNRPLNMSVSTSGEGFWTLGEFVQIVVTKNGNNVWYYRNGGDDPGEAVCTEWDVKYEGAVPEHQWIGTRYILDRYKYGAFNGQMSIVRIYNRPLTAKEVAGNYAAKLSKPAPQQGQLTMKPAADSFTIRADAGPKNQTISLPAGKTAPAGGAPVTIRYNESVVRVYSDAGAAKPVASGGTVKIAQGKSAVTVYVKAHSEGSSDIRSWTLGIFGAKAKYKVAIVPVPRPKGIATDGLVVAYRAGDADGAGNPGTGDRKTWTDLAMKDGVRNDGRLFHFKFQKGSGWVENTDQPKNSPFRYGLEFEATTHYNGDYVNISPLAPVKADSLTYEFWLKPDKESYTQMMTLIGQYAGNTGNNVLGTSVAGWVLSAQPRKDGGTSWSGPDSFRPIGKYVQLVVTKKGKDLWFYVNGADTPAKTAHVVQTDTHAAPAPNRQCLGMYWASDGRLLNAFTGQMSIVRVYKRPLSAQEVAGNYAAEMGKASP